MYLSLAVSSYGKYPLFLVQKVKIFSVFLGPWVSVTFYAASFSFSFFGIAVSPSNIEACSNLSPAAAIKGVQLVLW